MSELPCSGWCATGEDVGMVEYSGVIIPHPQCPLHGVAECDTCGSDDPRVQKVRGPGQRWCPDEFHNGFRQGDK